MKDEPLKEQLENFRLAMSPLKAAFDRATQKIGSADEALKSALISVTEKLTPCQKEAILASFSPMALQYYEYTKGNMALTLSHLLSDGLKKTYMSDDLIVMLSESCGTEETASLGPEAMRTILRASYHGVEYLPETVKNFRLMIKMGQEAAQPVYDALEAFEAYIEALRTAIPDMERALGLDTEAIAALKASALANGTKGIEHMSLLPKDAFT